MKTCVLLSGKSNDFYHVYKKENLDFSNYYENIYNKIIRPFHADVFISTWDFDGIEKLIDTYNPKLIRIEDYNNFEVRRKIFRNNIDINKYDNKMLNNIYPMFYKIYDCGLLKQEYETLNNFKYDLVIRSRFNLIFGNVHTSSSIQFL